MADVAETHFEHFGLLRHEGNILEPLPQPTSERFIEPVATTRLMTIGRSPDDPPQNYNNANSSAETDDDVLFNPRAVALSADESLAYVVDVSRMQVRVFSLNTGSFVRAIGDGPGEGPKEFRSIREITVADDGDVWVVDARANRLTIFSADGELRQSDKYDFMIGSLAVINDGHVLTSQLNRLKTLHVFDNHGSEVQSLGQFANHPRLNMGIFGSLKSTATGFVWVGFYAGQLAAFDGQGQLVFYRSTLYPTKPPRLNGNRMDPVEGPVMARIPLNVEEETLFVTAVDTSIAFAVADAYSLTDGRYLYSVPNPEAETCAIAAVTTAHVYTLCINDGKLTQWKRPAGPAVTVSHDRPAS